MANDTLTLHTLNADLTAARLELTAAVNDATASTRFRPDHSAIDNFAAAVLAAQGRQVWLMECGACHTFGTPMRPDETVCGNCGKSGDTRMWFRYVPR